jgi:hypothetical protein
MIDLRPHAEGTILPARGAAFGRLRGAQRHAQDQRDDRTRKRKSHAGRGGRTLRSTLAQPLTGRIASRCYSSAEAIFRARPRRGRIEPAHCRGTGTDIATKAFCAAGLAKTLHRMQKHFRTHSTAGRISRISNFIMPRGTWISTLSPTLCPTSPWAKGLVIWILPLS